MTAAVHPAGIELACPKCGRRTITCIPGQTAICHATSSGKHHRPEIMRPVQDITSETH